MASVSPVLARPYMGALAVHEMEECQTCQNHVLVWDIQVSVESRLLVPFPSMADDKGMDPHASCPKPLVLFADLVDVSCLVSC